MTEQETINLKLSGICDTHQKTINTMLTSMSMLGDYVKDLKKRVEYLENQLINRN